MKPSAVRLVLTAGEPAGIGPDICLMLATRQLACRVAVIADSEVLQRRADQLGLPVRLHIMKAGEADFSSAAGTLNVIHIPAAQAVRAGQLDHRNARYVLQCIDKAVQLCLDRQFDAVVTAPVHKGIINEAGVPFTGHTEYLQQLTATPSAVMMLATSGLRVALVTTHAPLRAVSDMITFDRVEQTVKTVWQALREDFAIARPNLFVCGLNPHAGEDGHLGREDQDIVAPALEHCRTLGISIQGPLPADTLFIPRYLDHCDAVIAMYHDQGLPVLKFKGFGQAVNITLGLPIVRTSVDHGTALELAGSGKADAGSLVAAVATASDMVRHRQAH